MIPITPQQAVLVEQLPAIHADPFDRLLVVRGLSGALRLVTHDAIVASYSAHIIRVRPANIAEKKFVFRQEVGLKRRSV